MQNLIEHMDQRVPGHGQKLAAQLGVSDQQLEGEASFIHTSENIQAMSRVPQMAKMVFKGAAKWFKNRKRRKF